MRFRLSAAVRGIVLVAAALALASLFNAQGLRKTATIQPEGLRRDVSLALTRPLAAVSHFLYLDRPRQELLAAIGRGGDDRVDATVLLPPQPSAPVRPRRQPKPAVVPGAKPQPRPAFTPAHPLRVWVAGDSLVQVPGESLERAVGTGGAVQVVALESRVATGLTRPDVYNWFTRFHEVAARLRPRVAVLSFGINDAHDYMAGLAEGRSVGPIGSPSWIAEYRRRVEGVTRELAGAGVYVVWVGLPLAPNPARNERFRVINRILRESAEAAPGRSSYVDAYSLFAVAGQWRAYRRDDRGRLVQMRAGDGIHYLPAAGDVLANVVLQRLGQVFDLGGKARR
jgi:hypothetical protein